MSLRASLAWSWTALILGLCWFPRSMMRGVESGPKVQVIPHLDKMVHFGIFFGFAWLWARARPGRIRQVFLGGVALAVLSEVGQMAPIVNRDAGLADGLADILGVASGLGADLLAHRLATGRKIPAA